MPQHSLPAVKLQPVATTPPAPQDQGTVRECPVCFDEVKENNSWLLLPCRHGVCTSCYQKLIQHQHRVTTCPLCRMPLLEPVPIQPLAAEAADRIQPASNVSPASGSWISDYRQLSSLTTTQQHAQHGHTANAQPPAGMV